MTSVRIVKESFMADLFCYECKEKLLSGDKCVIGENNTDLMCQSCFEELDLKMQEYKERMKHDGSYMYHEAHESLSWGNSEQRAFQEMIDRGDEW
jgi:hypothetical protein